MTLVPTRSSLFAATLLSVSLALPGWAQEDTAATETAPTPEVSADMVLATVNGEEITLGHIVAARGQLPAQYQQLPDEVLFTGLIDQLIQQAVLSQAIDEVGTQVELKLENERRSLVAAEKIEEVITEAVSDEAIQAAYDETYASAEPGTEWNAAHILVETQEEAAEIAEKARAEDADFAALAKEFSTGPSGPNGGELGWFSAGMMVPEFETAVADMAAGDVSDPIQTQFGWHVVKLMETREKGAPTLDEVREEIIGQLQTTAVETALAALIDAATIDRADVTAIPPSVLSDPTIFE